MRNIINTKTALFALLSILSIPISKHIKCTKFPFPISKKSIPIKFDS